MRLRPIHLFLLAAIVYWTTGAATYLHERIEHSEPDGADVAAVADVGNSDLAQAGNHSTYYRGRDDCRTCRLLTYMRAHRAASPVLVSGHLPCFCAFPVTDGADVVPVSDSQHSGSSPIGNHSKHHHDHNDCPTCQLLAHMQAQHVVPPVLVSAHLPCFCTLAVVDRHPLTIDVLVFAPIRGPPAAVGHIV